MTFNAGQRPTSEVGCIVDSDGNISDAGFHWPILDALDEESDRRQCIDSMKRSIFLRGTSPEVAASLYGMPVPTPAELDAWRKEYMSDASD